ncbi:hypothetical protein ACFV6G_00470 [Streptomyces lavendulae]|uniref:hypothetical protein n=1 Tax=Streptomyces lavendulae TaxID=1914 RepID=UPI00368DCFC1
MSVKIEAAVATPNSVLSTFVEAVKADSGEVSKAITGRITESQDSGHVVMMGGWVDAN